MADAEDSLERRAARRRREMSTAVLRDPSAVEAFDRDFWRRAGHEARFAAAWQMVLDRELMRGGDRARQPRLQRSVAVLKRPGEAPMRLG